MLFLLMAATSPLYDLHAIGAYVTGIVVTVVYGAALVVALVIGARRRGPNFTAEGQLKRLDGLELAESATAGGPSAVADVHRHQYAISAAAARGADGLRALLVPDAGSWLGLRSDVAVYLLTAGRFYHVGRLSDHAQVGWQGVLDELRAAGRYAVVPAEVTGVERAFKVDVRLEGLRVGEAGVVA
ncbi:hypothetical protein D7I44_13910 [Gryllotalpicola protaetiae]|uniref:Uncharacterized protein n=1 Tax=Gryllotalpicola protaetiae TaxID=2419771 RepID=A0A387BTZ9_9MICO|nr:hypothetical protein D7I44_13910 [Gryllotalpicola protaetiae]